MSENESEFDGMLMNIAERRRGIDPLLDSVFGFLRRKTDFFKGASSIAAAEKTLMESFKKHVALAEQEMAKEKAKEQKKKAKAAAESKKKEEAEAAKTAGVIEDPNKDGMVIEEVTEDEPVVVEEAKPADSKPSAEKVTDVEVKDGDAEEEDDPNKIKPNGGNGGDMEGYSWIQTLEELTVTVPVPGNMKGKDVVVDISKTNLKVGLKNKPAILEGKLSKTVNAEDAIWTLETTPAGKSIVITMEKTNQMEWWGAVVEEGREDDV